MATPQVPFTQCPAIGADTGCGVLVQITDGGTNVFSDPNQPPYDNIEDTLIGVVNDSTQPLTSLQLSSNTDLFGFDGDGLCTASGAPAGCPFGPTGYEGPNTSFSNISGDLSGGVVTFTTPLPPGATAYLSLEEALTATAVFAGGPTTSEQGRGTNPSQHITTCFAKQPINCATGVFLHDFTDFTIPGRGPALTLTRSYTSATAGTDGPFGFGWTTSYSMSLATDTTGTVVISQENGSTVSFRPTGTGTFTAPPRVLATLVSNPDGSYTFTRRATQIRYTFSSAGTLTNETDLTGNTTTLTYSGGQLSTVTDPSGRTLTFTSAGSHITRVTDPLGRAYSYQYDTAGNLGQATDPAGRSYRFGYDSNHLLLTMTDPRGGVVTNVYDASGRVVRQTDATGLATTWAYTGDPVSPAGGTTTMTDEHSNTTLYTYANLELGSVTHGVGSPAAATTSYTFDVATLGQATVTDPNGHVTTNSYDRDGNLTLSTDPAGGRTTATYNNLAEPTSRTTPAGETTSLTYDSTGNLTEVTDPTGKTTTYAHADPAHPGDITAVTDPDGRVKTVTYDPAGNVASTSYSPSAGVTQSTRTVYDTDSERVCQASPNATAAGVSCPAAGAGRIAGTSTWTYNPDGQPTTVTDPAGHATTYAYDAGGNLTSVTDPLGHITATTYDADNRPVTVTIGADAANASVTRKAYDLAPGTAPCPASASGATYCSTVTDPNGQTTVNAFTARDQVLSQTRPGGQTTAHQYDLAGNETGRLDAAGRTTSYGYDPANRLTGITYTDGVTANVTYSYDSDGRRIVMTDGTGTSNYTYDPASRLLSVSIGAGATIGYGYDGAGNTTSLTYPDGKTVTRTYDGAGQLATVTDAAGHTTTFTYDPNGNLTNTTYPNGDTVSSTFDATDQMTGTQAAPTNAPSTPLLSLADTRDADQQLTRETTGAGLGSGSRDYTYDPKHQLTTAAGTPYTYDLAGHPTNLGASSQTFDPASQLTAATRSGATTTFGSDRLGNRTSADPPTGTAYGYTYDQANRLTTVTSTTKTVVPAITAIAPASGPTTGGTVVSISGTGFTGATAVTFGTQRATAMTVMSDTSIMATAPAGTGTVDVTVTTPGGTSAKVAADQFTYVTNPKPLPAILAVIPNFGPTTGGQVVLIAGNNFTKATAVKFGTKPSPRFGVLCPGLIIAVAPAGTGTVDVTVTTPAGTSTTTPRDRFTYLARGQRPPAPIPAASSTPPAPAKAAVTTSAPTTLATYAYNGDGLRTSKTLATNSEQFTWDTSGQLPQILTDDTTSFVYGPDNLPIEQIDNGGATTYFVHDHLGSTRALLAADGTVAATFTYDPYGQTTNTTGTAHTPLLYTGAFIDGETGLYYLIHRHYDPATAQFLTLDPALDLTLSPYGYVNNDPTNDTDPSGTFGHIVLGALIGGIVGTTVGIGGYALDTLVFHTKEPSLRGLAGAAAGGFVNGAITGACDAGTVLIANIACGAAGGAAGELTNELVAGQPINLGDIGFAGALGGITGGIFRSARPVGRPPYKLQNIFQPGINAQYLYKGAASAGARSETARSIADYLRHSQPAC